MRVIGQGMKLIEVSLLKVFLIHQTLMKDTMEILKGTYRGPRNTGSVISVKG